MREQMKATRWLMSAMFVESCFIQVDTLHSSLRTMRWSFSPAVFCRRRSLILCPGSWNFFSKLYWRKTLPWCLKLVLFSNLCAWWNVSECCEWCWLCALTQRETLACERFMFPQLLSSNSGNSGEIKDLCTHGWLRVCVPNRLSQQSLASTLESAGRMFLWAGTKGPQGSGNERRYGTCSIQNVLLLAVNCELSNFSFGLLLFSLHVY